MIEQFLPGFTPSNETQQNIAYGVKLYQAGRLADTLAERFFKPRREELEEQLLERQLEAMGDNPDTQSFNKAVMAKNALPSVPGFLSELFGRSPSPRKPFSFTGIDTSNVDFRMALGKTGRDMAKRAIFKAL